MLWLQLEDSHPLCSVPADFRIVQQARCLMRVCLNPPIFLQWQFWAKPPNLIPANISGCTVRVICTVIII